MDMFSMFEEEEKKDDEPLVLRHLDIETQRGADQVGWDNKDLMYVSVAVTYCEPENEYRYYLEKDMPKLERDLLEADRVIGYNLCGFDYEVLEHYFDPWKLPTVDMMLDIRDALGTKRSKSLDNIAGATIGCKKTADGLMALQWWKDYQELLAQGNDEEAKKVLRKIAIYCKGDVKVTKDTYWYKEKNNILFYTNNNDKKTEVKNVRWTIRKGKSEF